MIRLPVSREYFEELSTYAMKGCLTSESEHLLLELEGECGQFVRVTGGKVRQIGSIEDATLEITLIHQSGSELRRASVAVTASGLSWRDRAEIDRALSTLRSEVPGLPPDPMASLPERPTQGQVGIRVETAGEIPAMSAACDTLLGKAASGLDLVGIYAGGSICRAMANSAGLSHWFATETFSFDYSVYTAAQKALKGTYAGSRFSPEEYAREMLSARQRLSHLEKPSRTIDLGEHRAYLAPAAVSELLQVLAYGALGEAAFRQGESPLRLVRSGERGLSPRFSLSEDFRGGHVPRFNELGEVSDERVPIIEHGKLMGTLVSTRTAKEYGCNPNGASEYEMLRSPVIEPGRLSEAETVRALDKGVYLSNLHYLNWSDQPGGRITGMTRYACFWVEHGKIVAPIENMRWDDSVFSLLGSSLEDFTTERSFIPEVHTYGGRQLGGALVPGALLSKMSFTI